VNPVSAVAGPAGLATVVRREQSERELRRVQTAVDGWFTERRDAMDGDRFPFADLHMTRLAALETVLHEALDALASALVEVRVDPGRDRAAVYRDCQDIDFALVWVYRVFTYYRDKFDQRDDPALCSTLLAADEVVWSCYKWVFGSTALPPGSEIGPAPLAYIDSQYSPATWETAKGAPSALRDASDVRGLERFLETLPIPLLRLPPWSVDAPWWLVFIAHEVGHNIQRELGLIEPFRTAVARAWSDAADDANDRRDRWSAWDVEVFADLSAVALIGPWAIRGLREIVLGPAQDMALPAETYPAPIVRLRLMAGALDELGFDATGVLAGLDPGASTASDDVERDLDEVDDIVRQALGPLDEAGTTLAGICRTPEVTGVLPSAAQKWAESLPSVATSPIGNVPLPRQVVCGTFSAWEQATIMATEAQRTSALDQLSRNGMETLRASGPVGKRAPSVEPSVEGHGTSLAMTLLELGRTRPGVRR